MTFIISLNILLLNHIIINHKFIGANMKKQPQISILVLILVGTLLVACNDESDNVITSSKFGDDFQSLTSLEGTVWVHHPDTDPQGQNWFNLGHSPSNLI